MYVNGHRIYCPICGAKLIRDCVGQKAPANLLGLFGMDLMMKGPSNETK